MNYIYKLLLGLYKFCYRLSIKIYAGLFKFIEGEANLTYFRKQSVANLIHVNVLSRTKKFCMKIHVNSGKK